jgi:hypothetical protein
VGIAARTVASIVLTVSIKEPVESKSVDTND